MSTPLDDYEKKYMAGEGGILFHTKVNAPRLLSVGLLATTAIAAAAAIVGGAPLFVTPIVLGLSAFAWMNMLSLRTVVSRRFVHIQYGLFGPKIDVDNIIDVRVVDYSWLKYGGWGIKLGFDGSVAYNMMGDQGRAVQITVRGKRRSQKILLSAENPEALAAVIEEARLGVFQNESLDDVRGRHTLASSSSSSSSSLFTQTESSESQKHAEVTPRSSTTDE